MMLTMPSENVATGILLTVVCHGSSADTVFGSGLRFRGPRHVVPCSIIVLSVKFLSCDYTPIAQNVSI